MQEYKPLPVSLGSSGSIYNSGFVASNNANVAQNELNNSTRGGKRKSKQRQKFIRKLRGGTYITPIPVPYSDAGATNANYATLSAVSSQNQANSQYDTVSLNGGKRRTNKSKRRTNKSKRRTNKSKRRTNKRRRHHM